MLSSHESVSSNEKSKPVLIETIKTLPQLVTNNDIDAVNEILLLTQSTPLHELTPEQSEEIQECIQSAFIQAALLGHNKLVTLFLEKINNLNVKEALTKLIDSRHSANSAPSDRQANSSKIIGFNYIHCISTLLHFMVQLNNDDSRQFIKKTFFLAIKIGRKEIVMPFLQTNVLNQEDLEKALNTIKSVCSEFYFPTMHALTLALTKLMLPNLSLPEKTELLLSIVAKGTSLIETCPCTDINVDDSEFDEFLDSLTELLEQSLLLSNAEVRKNLNQAQITQINNFIYSAFLQATETLTLYGAKRGVFDSVETFENLQVSLQKTKLLYEKKKKAISNQLNQSPETATPDNMLMTSAPPIANGFHLHTQSHKKNPSAGEEASFVPVLSLTKK